jgi:DMSO/TMAO reductase YedYZ heme-binding membrane subunit
VAGVVNASGLTWEIARAGGFMAYGLLTASVAIGLVVSLKWRSPRWTRFITTELHRFVTLLALVFTGLHTVMVAIDPFITFTPVEVLVPFLSHYRPLWIALGIVGAYLMAAVYLSDWIRPRVGYGWWRRFHYLSFVVFLVTLVHGLGTGSDTRTPWAIGVYAASVVLVGALISVRAMPSNGERSHSMVAGLTVGGLLVGAYWAWQGPLQPGWNAIANDAHGSGGATVAVAGADPSAARSASPSPSSSHSPVIPQAFSDTMTGQFAGSADGTIVLSATLQSSRDRLTVRFPASQGGPLLVDGAKLVLLAPDGDTCAGSVQSLTNNVLVATCQGVSSGSTWLLRMAVTTDASGAVRGSIQANPR